MGPEISSGKLIEWYRLNRRDYPWRQTEDPYLVWLSEILLQQTRIAVALPYFAKIRNVYPDIKALAEAPLQAFLSAWSGVGYYSRARNMHRCAQEILRKHEGRFPSDFDALISLPGIGDYTAAALLNVCFDTMAPALDANISRVLARLFNVRKPAESPAFRKTLRKSYIQFSKGSAPDEFFQAMMDLGENVCLPTPLCSACPVNEVCLSHLNGKARTLPVKKPKRKAEKYYWYFLFLRKRDSMFVVRNPERPFLKDFWLFPDLLSRKKLRTPAIAAGFQKIWNLEIDNLELKSTAKHSVTYRNMDVHLFSADCSKLQSTGGRWMDQKQLEEVPTSSVLWKLL